MLNVLNTLTVDGRTYSTDDILPGQLARPSEYGCEAGFYGGRVQWVAKARDSDVLLLVSTRREFEVIDTAVVEDEEADDADPEPATVTAAPSTTRRSPTRRPGRRKAAR